MESVVEAQDLGEARSLKRNDKINLSIFCLGVQTQGSPLDKPPVWML